MAVAVGGVVGGIASLPLILGQDILEDLEPALEQFLARGGVA